MSKRYVFFRMPTGKPYRGTDGKYAPAHLLAEIGKAAGLSAEGGVQWTSLIMPRFQVALRSALVVLDPRDDELNETDAWHVVSKGLNAVLKLSSGKPVNTAQLVAEADKAAAAFFRKPLVKYVLVSSLSVAELPSKNIITRGCTVTSLKERGKRFPLPKVLDSLAHRATFANHLKSTKYRLIKVTTEGRSIFEATGKALNALTLLRGLWSLFSTYGSWSLSVGGPVRKPIGAIHTGPIYTLHLPDGRAASEELYWYDPDYTEDQSLFEHIDRWDAIEKNRRMAMRRLAALPYGREVEELLIRYAVALDQPNTDIAFLQMWSILEKITDTVGTNYDETIKRAIWIFSSKDRLLTKDLLESVRFLRNRYVHSGRSGQEGDQVAYLIKLFVDPHLKRLIANPFKIGSLEEYGKFLALPTDVKALEQQQRNLGRALRVLRTKKGSK
jgi:hypothetical protein